MSYEQFQLSQQYQQNQQYQQYQQYPQYQQVPQKRSFLKNPGFMPWSPLVFWIVGAIAIAVISFVIALILAIRSVMVNGELAGWLLVISPVIGAMLASAVSTLSNIIPVIFCVINLSSLPKLYPPVSESKKTLIIVTNILWAVIAIGLAIFTGPSSIESFRECLRLLL